MKKTLIAVAALAATTAFAQNVTVTGTLDATYRTTSTDYANGASKKDNEINNDGSGTTGVTFSGMEDLGGGLKAVFLYEMNFEVSDTTSNPFAGQQYVGLDGAFGSVKIGSPNTPHLSVQGARGAGFGTKDGGRAAIFGTTLFGASLTRFADSVGYTSPNFSGFSFGLNYVPKTDNQAAGATPATTTGATTDVGAFYANGPLYVGVASYSKGEVTGGAPAAKITQTSYVVSYNFGFAKFTLGGHNWKQDTDKNSGVNVAADVPLSPALTLTANIQQLNDKDVANEDLDQVAVGLNYAMSKRTSTYVRYVSESMDNAGTGTNAKDATRFLVGLRHNF